MRVRGPPSPPGGWDPATVRSAHHAQINEPLQRPQVRRQCILNCRLSLQQCWGEKVCGRDEKGAEEEFCGRQNL